VPLFQNESSCNTFHENDLLENEPVGGTHFHMNGFALRLVLTERQKASRKWPIKLDSSLVRFYLALINRVGGLYGGILTEVVSTDRTQ